MTENKTKCNNSDAISRMICEQNKRLSVEPWLKWV